MWWLWLPVPVPPLLPSTAPYQEVISMFGQVGLEPEGSDRSDRPAISLASFPVLHGDWLSSFFGAASACGSAMLPARSSRPLVQR